MPYEVQPCKSESFPNGRVYPPKLFVITRKSACCPPPKRLENSYRDYGEVDVARARFVVGARRLDFSLDDIQEILDLRDRRTAPCRVVLDLLAEKAEQINQRIAELQRIETELRELHHLGETFPTDDVDGKNCVCHLVSERSEYQFP